MRRRKGRKSEARRIIDLGIYCAAVLMVFFAVVLLVQEYEYVPQEVYADPPPPAPSVSALPTQTAYPAPTATPYSVNTPTPAPTDAAQTAEPDTTPTAAPEETSAPAPTATPGFPMDELHPVKLYFIERRISCDVKPVGINSRNEMDTIRSPYDAGWLYPEPYVLPGDTGKAIIAGHNRWNGHNGTFSVLKKVEAGETVAVEMSDGYARYFRIDEITECAYNDNSIMEPVYDRSVLILITCKGDWDSVLHTSRTRIIAVCTPVE